MNNLSIAVKTAIDGRLTQVWTALPVTVETFNATLQTVQVRPQIIPLWNNPTTGQREPLPIPIINDCPVCFPGGGGFHLTFPLLHGDEGLLILASRCIDGWWSTGKGTPQNDLRMHDLSDGFFIPGVKSKPNALTGVSTSKVQLRNDAGNSFVDIDGSGNIVVRTLSAYVTVSSSGLLTLDSLVGVTINAPAGTITANGNVLG